MNITFIIIVAVLVILIFVVNELIRMRTESIDRMDQLEKKINKSGTDIKNVVKNEITQLNDKYKEYADEMVDDIREISRLETQKITYYENNDYYDEHNSIPCISDMNESRPMASESDSEGYYMGSEDKFKIKYNSETLENYNDVEDDVEDVEENNEENVDEEVEENEDEYEHLTSDDESVAESVAESIEESLKSHNSKYSQYSSKNISFSKSNNDDQLEDDEDNQSENNNSEEIENIELESNEYSNDSVEEIEDIDDYSGEVEEVEEEEVEEDLDTALTIDNFKTIKEYSKVELIDIGTEINADFKKGQKKKVIYDAIRDVLNNV